MLKPRNLGWNAIALKPFQFKFMKMRHVLALMYPLVFLATAPMLDQTKLEET